MKFTLLTNRGGTPVPGKMYARVGKDVEKAVNGEYLRLSAKVMSCDLAGLKQLIENSTPDQHLTSGTPEDDCDLAPVGNAAGLRSRCNNDLVHRVGPGLMVIDSDNLVGETVWGMLCAACPGIEGHARLEASSTGANLFAGKTRISGETGQHTFVHVVDSIDIPRALTALHRRLVMTGHARYRVSVTGNVLERTAVDQAMLKSSQPVYLRPTLVDLTQKKRIELFPGHEVMDTRLCIPDLTAEEELAFAQADAVARAALRSDAEAAAAAYDEARGKDLPGGAAEARSARLGRRLPRSWVVTLSDGTAVTVGAILASPDVYHGKTCRDPLEPEYGSRTVAKIFVRQDAPLINSQAHGGAVYHLGEAAAVQLPGSQFPEARDDEPLEIISQYIRMPFPVSCFPAVMAGACVDVQYLTQAPMALVAGSAITALSTASMGYVDAVRSPTLKGPCSTVVIGVAASSERKSTVDKHFSAPLREHEMRAMAKHKTDSIMPSVKYDKWEAQTATLEKAMRDAVESDSKGMPNEVKQADAAADRLLKFRTENPEPKRPPCPRMIYDVLTVEKMHQAFANYPLMVVMSDEGGTFVGSRAMNKESAMSTMALINKAYGGDPINKDIKSTEPEVCPTPRFTMHLMLQPGVFDQLTAGGQARDIGLISRALLCEPESTRGTRFLEGREEGGTFGIDLFNQNISQLLSQQVVIDADGKLICKEMRMSPEAKTVWVKFHDHIEALVGDGGIYAGISDMAGKVAENAARLATQFAFFEGHASITKVTMLNACSIVEWYLNESLVLLGLKKESEEKRDAVTIESWIIKECIKKGVDYVTERDVSDNINCRALRKESGKKRRMTAFNLLVECRRLRGARAGNSFRLYPLPDLLVKARENML